MSCDLTAPEFTDEAAAVAHMEASRWPNGAVCPLCQSENVRKMEAGKQAGMFLCNACRKKFTVRTGTVFERSHIPLHKWLFAMHLMAASKKGVSAHQLHRMLGITYKSAWFMAHRIREAMAPAQDAPKLGGEGQIVESDDTQLAPSRKTKGAKGRTNNKKFMTLIERGGAARSKMITSADAGEIKTNLVKNVHPDSILHTDGARVYKGAWMVKAHEAVDHNKEYARNGETGRVHIKWGGRLFLFV